jgi:hypothetical protein
VGSNPAGGAYLWGLTLDIPHECLNGMLGALEAKNIYPYTAIYDDFTGDGYICVVIN